MSRARSSGLSPSGFLRSFRQTIRYLLFLAGGKKPWSRGYDVYKNRSLRHALGPGGFARTGSLPSGFGFRLDERIVEYPWFFSLLPESPGKLLDAGSILNHEVVIGHPKLKNKDVFISTLAPEENCFWQDRISYVFDDLRRSCFREDFFDWIACISTLEHVGMDNTRFYCRTDLGQADGRQDVHLDAIRDFHRILRPGGTLFLTVPFGKAKNHGWFQVFDQGMADQVIHAFAPRKAEETVYRYRPDGWTVSDREEAKDATFFDIRERKDYDPDFAAGSRAVICLKLEK